MAYVFAFSVEEPDHVSSPATLDILGFTEGKPDGRAVLEHHNGYPPKLKRFGQGEGVPHVVRVRMSAETNEDLLTLEREWKQLVASGAVGDIDVGDYSDQAEYENCLIEGMEPVHAAPFPAISGVQYAMREWVLYFREIGEQ